MAMRIAAAMGTTYVRKSFAWKLKIMNSRNWLRLTDENITKKLRCAKTKLSFDIKKINNHIQK